MKFTILNGATISGPSFYQDFNAGLCRALEEAGHQVYILNFESTSQPSQADIDEITRWFRSPREDAIIDWCCWGANLTSLKVKRPSGGAISIFQERGVPYIGLLADQPYKQPIPLVRSNRLQVGYPDLAHGKLLRSVYPNIGEDRSFFFPIATRAENFRAAGQYRDRGIEVLYIGNLPTQSLERSWGNSELAEALDDVVTISLKGERLPHAIDHVFAARALALDPETRGDLLRRLERHLRATFRYRVIEKLACAGISIHVCGEGWRNTYFADKINIIEPVDYEGLLRLMAAAKLYIDPSTYIDGTNDRMFSAMLNGSAFLTNAEGYLGRRFQRGCDIDFFDIDKLDLLPEQIKQLLSNQKELQDLAAAGQKNTMMNHLWRNRVDLLTARCSG